MAVTNDFGPEDVSGEVVPLFHQLLDAHRDIERLVEVSERELRRHLRYLGDLQRLLYQMLTVEADIDPLRRGLTYVERDSLGVSGEVVRLPVRSTPTSPLDDRQPLPEQLSGAEARVVRYLPTNLTMTEIADELYASVNTVKTHLRHIYAKLGGEPTQRSGRAGTRARAASCLVGSALGSRVCAPGPPLVSARTPVSK